MNITAVQAVLCGIVYWLAVGNLPFVGLWTLQRPLVCGTVVGLILGHPVEGAVIGASISLVYIGFVSAGGSMPADISLAGILGTVYAVSSGVDASTALTLAVPIGLLGTVIWTGRMTLDSIFVHLADRYIEKEEYYKIWRANVLFPQLLCAAMAIVPCALAAYFGSTYVSTLVSLLDGRVLTIMQIIGELMPCLGIAVTLLYIFEGEAKIFLFIGFLLAAYTEIPVHMIGAIAVLSAILYVRLRDGRQAEPAHDAWEESGEDAAEPDEEERGETELTGQQRGLIPKAALVRAWLIWETFPQTCYNYERMMGQHMAHMFVPLLRYLYPGQLEKRQELMKREITFFNTHVEFGACVPGMTIALEEQMAMSGMVTDSLIKNLKTAFMGSLAGIGDTLWQGVFLPVMLGFCIDITNFGGGNIWGAVIYTVVVIAAACVISYLNFMFGYRMGGSAIVELLEHGTLKKLIKGASIMGCMVMGALIVKYVSCVCGMAFTFSGTTYNLQTDLFDVICPYILPLSVTMLAYYLLKRRGWSTLKVLLLLIALGVIGSATGILSSGIA